MLGATIKVIILIMPVATIVVVHDIAELSAIMAKRVINAPKNSIHHLKLLHVLINEAILHQENTDLINA